MTVDWNDLDWAAGRLVDAPAAGLAVLREVTTRWHLPDDALTGLTRPISLGVAGLPVAVALTPADLIAGYLPVLRRIHEKDRHAVRGT